MVEVSNNLLAGLLIVAIVISGSGLLIIGGMGPVTITGRELAYGTANVTITGQVAIEMVRNVTNFGSSVLAGAQRIIHTQQDNSFSATLDFNNGSEGNGTDYGTGSFAYPFVIRNIGNVNASINISAGSEATSWMGEGGAAAFFKGKNNESAACGADFGGEFGEGSWTALNVSDTEACSSMDFHEPTPNEMRVHFRLNIPSDVVGTKGEIIEIGAITA